MEGGRFYEDRRFSFWRKNSKGLKNKNIRKINGKPAFSHVVDEVKKVKSIKKIYVSTDSEYIISKAKKKIV